MKRLRSFLVLWIFRLYEIFIIIAIDRLTVLFQRSIKSYWNFKLYVNILHEDESCNWDCAIVTSIFLSFSSNLVFTDYFQYFSNIVSLARRTFIIIIRSKLVFFFFFFLNYFFSPSIHWATINYIKFWYIKTRTID